MGTGYFTISASNAIKPAYQIREQLTQIPSHIQIRHIQDVLGQLLEAFL